ncbi:hypothetical protein STCU_00831 [Strigomonas culicis]|uniref:Uncharacterized protein n=1 Tax=Strigomonas culicis TaxID=28005 RepID=S9TXP6_9TRYP|nr:hypothetical protein STCU_08570 [Strigomonas culicis]EPY26908.1 hypothetical protein STCU_06018 [Strigomonas culicis]EPY35948.1 hypothetical protein STCU_00831 [Strigomonas culicis]|eukprot:EPY21384.1 hypothetical protein STCU_08570 [Strigomonas culicis]
MPHVIVTCLFNPPSISIQGASLRQDTIDALQRALPKHTTTSQLTYGRQEPPKFLLTASSAHPEAETGEKKEQEKETDATTAVSAALIVRDRVQNLEEYTSLKIELGKHYCCQKGRSMMFLAIMEALEEEGFAMRSTSAVTMDNGKDVTRLFFSRF